MGLQTKGFETLENRIVFDGGLAIGVEHLGSIPWNDTKAFVEFRPQLASADFNGDGQLDLAIANDSELQFILHEGQSAIAEPNHVVPQERAARHLKTADFDGDGRPDVITFDGASLHVHLNRSTPEVGLEFANPISSLVPNDEIDQWLFSSRFEDLDGDGNADMVRAVQGNGIIVSIGQGDGAFSAGVQYSEKSRFDMADLSGDGMPDLLVDAGFAFDEESQFNVPVSHLLINDGEGFFEFAKEVKHTKWLDEPQGPILNGVDFNSDGIDDRVGFLENQGGGMEFSVSTSIDGELEWEQVVSISDALIGGSSSVSEGTYADVNGDGLLDAIRSNGAEWHSDGLDSSSGGTIVMLGQGGGQFAAPVRISRALGDVAVAGNLIAMSAEGEVEIIRIADSPFGDFAVLERRGVRRAEGDIFNAMVVPHTTDLIDANDDGRLDFVRDLETVWLNVGEGQFEEDTELLQGSEASSLLDEIALQQPPSVSGSQIPSPLPGFAAWRKYESADFNGDGRLDVAVIDSSRKVDELKFDGSANDWSAKLSIWMGQDDGSFQLGGRIDGVGYTFDVDDLNGDGVADLAVVTHETAESSAELVVLVATNVGLLEAARLPAPAELNFVRATELNRDGLPDFILGSLDGSVMLLRSQQDDYQAEVHQIHQLIDDAFVGDMDRDGTNDVVVAEFGIEFRPGGSCFFCGVEPRFQSPEVSVNVLTGTNDGSFEPSLQTRVRAFTIDKMFVEDFDGDDDLDIALGGDHLAILWNPVEENREELALSDLYEQCLAIRTGDESVQYDHDADGQVDLEDLATLLAQGNTKPGDANLDGLVDFNDFLNMSANFGSVDAAWEQGDFDCDGEVSFADFLVLSANFD